MLMIEGRKGILQFLRELGESDFLVLKWKKKFVIMVIEEEGGVISRRRVIKL